MQVAPVLDLDRLALGIDSLDRLRLLEPQYARKGCKGVGEEFSHPLQTGKIARAAVDRGPGKDLFEHRLRTGALDRVLFAGRQPPHARLLAAPFAERHTSYGLLRAGSPV